MALRVGKPASFVLTTLRSFPSLEPQIVQPVSSKVLGLPPRRDLLWQAVTYERDTERVGSKLILGRADMGYSRNKLRPQKGTGRARMGDRGNPIRHDGGRAFPKHPPNKHATQLPSTVYALAMRTALSHQYRAGQLYIVQGEANFPSSHPLVGNAFVKQHGLKKTSVTIITSGHRAQLFDALQTCENVDVVPQELVRVQDILRPRRLIIEEDALRYLILKYREPAEIKAIRPVQTVADLTGQPSASM